MSTGTKTPRALALDDDYVPSQWRVQGALILTQITFGGGAVVGKFGIANFNPALFALIRECLAGPILLILAF